MRVVRPVADIAHVMLAASGSKVALALEAADLLSERGISTIVISVMWRERIPAALQADGTALPDLPCGSKPA